MKAIVVGLLTGSMISAALALLVLFSEAQPNVTWVFPRPDLTPGDVLTTDTKKVCAKGYSKRVRDVPETVRRSIFASYDVRWEDRLDYELDHLVPLELGGSNSVKNLWPQSRLIPVGAAQKDRVEDWLHHQVCVMSTMPLEQAQKQIRTDWYGVYRTCCVAKDEQDQPATQPTSSMP